MPANADGTDVQDRRGRRDFDLFSEGHRIGDDVVPGRTCLDTSAGLTAGEDLMVASAHEGGAPAGMTRRQFGAAAFGSAAAAGVAPATAAVAVGSLWSSKPVIGFHGDAPWVDPTGRDKPYRPPTVTGRFVPDAVSLACLGHFL